MTLPTIRSRLVALVALVGLVLPMAGCGLKSAPHVAKPRPAVDPATLPMKHAGCNVILVSFDALQASHVGCLGNPRPVTPNLDALAAESFNFRQAMSVSSWTVPATMTWLTGVYPSEHRLTNKFAEYQPPKQKVARLKELSPNLVTLAEVLKQNGYVTGGFTGNAGVSADFGFDQGFDVYFHDKGKFGSFEQAAPRAIDWLKANKDRKFFLFLHGYDVHGQASPAGGFDYRYVDRTYDKRYTGYPQEQEVLREEGLERGRVALRDADVQFWRAIYDEKLSRADRLFGQFLAELNRLGLAENTLLVVTSDHGTELWEHGRLDHGFTLYGELLHVPLFIRLPGQRSGKEIAERVSSVDVMPTILDLLEVEMPAHAQDQLRGARLAAAMRGESHPRDVFSETDYRQYTYKRSIITPDHWKLIYTLETRSRELFDLNRDPAELTNLAADEPARADELEARLFEHFRAIGHDLRSQEWSPGFNPVYGPLDSQVPRN
jgi:arylsulfatase A-like enzyme